MASLFGARDDEDDRSSLDGSWAHWQGASKLVAEQGAVAPEGGLKCPAPAGYEPPGFMHWVVDFYVRTVVEAAGGTNAIVVEDEMLVEFGRFWLSGHPDVYSINPDATEIDSHDLKSGTNPVDAAEMNWQVLGYAVLKKVTFPSLRRIRESIVQPRLRERMDGFDEDDDAPEVSRITSMVIDETGCHAERDGVMSQVNTVTVDQIVVALEASINAALDDGRTLETGLKQCRWCPAKMKCPAVDAEEDAMKLILTDELLERVKNTPDDETLGRICKAGKLLTPRFEAAKKAMKARLATEKIITLADGTQFFEQEVPGKRKIIDTGAAWEKVVEAVPAEAAYGCMAIKIEPVEKALAKAFKIPHKSENKDKLDGRKMCDQLIGHLITREPQKHLQIVG